MIDLTTNSNTKNSEVSYLLKTLLLKSWIKYDFYINKTVFLTKYA